MKIITHSNLTCVKSTASQPGSDDSQTDTQKLPKLIATLEGKVTQFCGHEHIQATDGMVYLSQDGIGLAAVFFPNACLTGFWPSSKLQGCFSEAFLCVLAVP